MKYMLRVSSLGTLALFVGIFIYGCGGSGTSGSDDTAVLSWSAPSTRVNGDSIAMGELDRYLIRYGQDMYDLKLRVLVDGADKYPEMSYTVQNLGAGTWYFTVQVQDKQGLVSEASVPV